MPTWAAVIIFTSLAPSPIAKVVLSGLDALTILTISAFYFGDTLQARTTLAALANSKNSSLTLSFLHILMSASPLTMTPFSLTSSVNF